MDAIAEEPNHHAHHAPFRGVVGVLAALSMTVRRGGVAALAAQLAAVRADDAVVDVGCGPGAAVRHAAALGANVTGVDPAAVMRRFARALTLRRRRRVTFLDGRAEALPLPDDAATVLWSISTVHHWQDIDRGLAEARRVLRAGGRFVAIEWRALPGATGLASHGWTDAQATVFAARAERAGLIDVRVEHHREGLHRPVVAVVGREP